MKKLILTFALLCLSRAALAAPLILTQTMDDFLSTPSSANFALAITGETGTGALVFGTSPTIAAPLFSGTITGTYTLGGTPTFPSAVSLDTEWNTVAKLETATGENITTSAELAAFAGTSNITTLGTIATGTWLGAVIDPAKLGSGSSITTKFLRGDGSWQTISSTASLTSTQIGFGNGSNVLAGEGAFTYDSATDTLAVPNQAVDTVDTAVFKIGGVTILPSAAELNFVDGVTSAIQTQLDAKAALASPTFTGNPLAPTASANDNDTSIATTAYVQTELTGYAADSATLTNKTFDAAGTGNVFKAKGYIYLTHPHLADGTNATINTTATAISYGHATFSNSVDQASNYVEYYIQVPEDIDTSVALRARLKVLLGNTDTASQRYVLSSVSVADSAVPTASTLANAINVDFAGDASGANGDVETSAWTTLTSWAGALTAGQTWRIRFARDGDTSDASTVNSTELGLVLEYGITQ